MGQSSKLSHVVLPRSDKSEPLSEFNFVFVNLHNPAGKYSALLVDEKAGALST